MNFQKYFLFFSLSALLAGPSCSPETAPPNIIMIMVDDMGFSDIGCYGGEIQTPNLDRLAANGLRYTQFYNASKCCPTRASLLTGLYAHEAGMGAMVAPFGKIPEKKGPYQGYLNDQCLTMAEVLKTADFATYMSGKWHVGENPDHWPKKRGFDRYFGLISGATSYYQIITNQNRVRMMVKEDEPWTPPAENFYTTDAFTDYALEVLDQHFQEQVQRPFFLSLMYNAPHWPLHALPDDVKRYQGQYSQGWEAVRQQRFQRQKTLGIIPENAVLPPVPTSIPQWDTVSNKAEWERRMEVYAAMIDRIDQNIGRLLDKLESLGQLEQTLIVFLSDNGGSAENITGRNLNDPAVPIGARGSYVAYREPWAMVSNTPFRWYKNFKHEGGTSSPLIVHWPKGISAKGQLIHQPAHIIDLMPTFVELADAKYPTSYETRPIKPLRGKSLASSFEPSHPIDERTLFFEFGGNKAVRQGDWKLVMRAQNAQWELYDLKKDPTELKNLISLEPDRFLTLRSLYGKWAEEVGVNRER